MGDSMSDKKRRAAIAAVLHYLSMELAQAGESVQPTEPEAEAVVETGLPDRSMLASMRPWGLSGRQAQMHMRTLVQMRAFK